MKIVRFTINIGGYDKDVCPDIMQINSYDLFRNNARNSRAIKLLAHHFVDADISVYYDANKWPAPLTDEQIIDTLGDGDMCARANGQRQGIYEEIALALNRVADRQEKKILIRQGEYYRKIGFPENGPVYGYQPLIRRHTPKVNAFFESWWAETCRWSYRDQVSFPVVLSRHPEIKVVEADLKYLYTKSTAHGGKVFPTVIPVSK
jgi:hypothetical protein